MQKEFRYKGKNGIEVDFGPMPNALREEYLDVYEGIHSEIVNTTRFGESSEHGYISGKLLD